MMLLYISLAITMFDILMFAMTCIAAAEIYKRRYPNDKFVKKSLCEKMLIYIRALAMCICPILNIALAWALVFKNQDIIEGAIRDMENDADRYNTCEEETHE